MKDTDYSKLFGLSFATIFAFVLALHAIALSNVPPQTAPSQSELRVASPAATHP